MPSAAALLQALPGPAGAAGQNPAMNRLEPKPTLGPQPLPGFRGDLAQNGAHPWAHPAVDKNQHLVFGALTEVTAGGWIECPNQLVGWCQPPGGARKAPRGR